MDLNLYPIILALEAMSEHVIVTMIEITYVNLAVY